MKDRIAFILSLFDTGLYAAQLFHTSGYSVVGFDYNPNLPGFYSNKVQAVLIENPIDNPSAVLAILISKASSYKGKPILLAASEVFLSFIADNRDALENWFCFDVPEDEILRKILSKSGQFEMAREVGLHVPEFIRVRNAADFDQRDVSRIRFPAIIKSDDQQIWKIKELPKSIIVKSKEDLINQGNKLIDMQVPFLVQSLIDGPVTNNYEYNALVLNGKVIEESTIRKVRQYSAPYGAAACTELCDNNDVKELARKFVLENKIEGFSNTEFKFNLSEGKYYFIECNARVWLQLKLSEHCGIRYINSYILRMSNLDHQSIKTKRGQKTQWVDFPYDLVLCIRNMRGKPWQALECILSYRHVKSFGLLNFHDFGPFIIPLVKKWIK